MSKMLDIIACAGITIAEFGLILFIAILGQFIVYQLTGISIFKIINNGLKNLNKYLERKFN